MSTPSDDPGAKPPKQQLAQRWVGPLFVVLSMLLVPWTIFLALTLPPGQIVPHYRGAWVGFDIGLIASLGSTGWAAVTRHRLLATLAAMSGTMLLVDGWFDVTTSFGRSSTLVAMVSAVGIEFPLAGLCLWLSANAALVVHDDVPFGRLRPKR